VACVLVFLLGIVLHNMSCISKRFTVISCGWTWGAGKALVGANLGVEQVLVMGCWWEDGGGDSDHLVPSSGLWVASWFTWRQTQRVEGEFQRDSRWIVLGWWPGLWRWLHASS
jgi:hypothetical protein